MLRSFLLAVALTAAPTPIHHRTVAPGADLAPQAADRALLLGEIRAWIGHQPPALIVHRDRPKPPAVRSVAAAVDPASLAYVLACIRAHESGDYANESHGPDGASGAYQMIGSTWRAWSARAGFPGYAAAHLAPPATQDAVALFMLTHGGAGNWSPRYGNDPCTVGMGG
jgi:hypothetical protein